MKKLNKILTTKNLIKFFIVSILLNFVVFNIVRFRFKIDFQPVWMFKEIIVIVFGLILLYKFFNKRIQYNSKKQWIEKTSKGPIRKHNFKKILQDKTVLILGIITIVNLILIATISLGVYKLPVYQYIMVVRYNFFGFFIFFIFTILSKFYDKKRKLSIINFILKTLKVLLVGGVFWYGFLILDTLSNSSLFHALGYAKHSIEQGLHGQTPALFFTQGSRGIVRNQFLFERPITWGFFLVALWPLFYIKFLQNKSIKKTWFRIGLYGFNILSTFSRAARGVWLIQIILIGSLTYKKNLINFFKKIIVPLIVGMILIITIGYKHIVQRSFSNTGHIVLVQEGFDMFMESPIKGVGIGSVGPASHWICSDEQMKSHPHNTKICSDIQQIHDKYSMSLKGFNTENQFLQVLIEFGLIGFVLWMIVYIYFNIFGVYEHIKKYINNKDISYTTRLKTSISIGIIGLSISGMVLHSFSDNMVVYPIMLITGIIYTLK